MANAKRIHHQAAFTYAGLGLLVLVITFIAGLAPASQRAAIEGLFVILCAVLIYRGWWLLSALLISSNLWRALTYFNAGLGWQIELLPFRVIRVEPKLVALINAALMVIIVVMLARSAWAGFSEKETK